MEVKQSYKIILVGNAGVGKTSIANMKCNDSFDNSIQSSVGTSSFCSTAIVDGAQVQLRIWDTAGQERYKSLVSTYARDAQIAIVVADIKDKDSIDAIDSWVDLVHDIDPDVLPIIAMNKFDLATSNQEIISKIQTTVGVKYPNLFFVSALTSYNIDELFNEAARKAVQSKIANSVQTKNDVDLKQDSNKNEGCC